VRARPTGPSCKATWRQQKQQESARKSSRLWFIICSVLVSWTAIGCAPPEAEVPELVREKTIDEYPGISYPAHPGALPAPGTLSGPVWLIGIDGATWDLMRPMMARGELPNTAALVDAGSHGLLRSEPPMISPALWATIATGMPRCVHGVVSFLARVPGNNQAVEIGPPDRRSPALWELVGAAGGSSCVVNWFGSFPAEQIDGIYVAKGFDPRNPQPEQVWPPDQVEALAAAVEPRLLPEEVAAIGRTPHLARTLELDALALATLHAATQNESSDLVAVYFSGLDVVEHLTWRHMEPHTQAFPEDGAPDPALAGVIPAYYRFVDRALGEIVEMAPPDTTFVVVSDHGQGPMELIEAFHLRFDELLRMMGLAGDVKSEVLVIDELYRHEKTVWLNIAGVEEGGTVALADAATVTERIEHRLRALRCDHDPALLASVQNLQRATGWQPGDPVLNVRFSSQALLARHAVDGDQTIDMSPVRVRHGDVSGAHKPEGVIILAGPAIRSGAKLQHANLFNIAPTVLYLLGLPQDDRILTCQPADGGVLVDALLPAVLARRPVAAVAEYPGTDRRHLLRRHLTTSLPEDPTRDESIERLRALGYVQ
jgi:predicted AlkP superfamily phosphohydrolase/phosphomutase